MLEFPPYAPISFFFAIAMLAAGIWAGVQNFFEWRALLRKRRTESHLTPDKRSRPSVQNILAIFASPLFVLVGTFILVSQPLAIRSFRQLELSDVSGATVYIAEDVLDFRSSEPRRITDAESLRSGLKLLSQCKSEVKLEKEHFTNGYVIMLESEKWQTGDYKIGVFRSTSRNKSKTGVIPYLSVGHTGYLCPSFQQWVTENIDPMFQATTAR